MVSSNKLINDTERDRNEDRVESNCEKRVKNYRPQHEVCVGADGLYFAVCIFSIFLANLSMLFMLLNPIIFLEEFFMLSMSGYSLFSSDQFLYLEEDVFLTKLLAHGPLWCIVSGVCMLGLSLFFMYLAARNIDPLKKKDKKIRKKQPIDGGKQK